MKIKIRVPLKYDPGYWKIYHINPKNYKKLKSKYRDRIKILEKHSRVVNKV